MVGVKKKKREKKLEERTGVREAMQSWREPRREQNSKETGGRKG